MARDPFQGAQADWDSGVAEYGEKLSGKWIEQWMKKWKFQELILNPGFTGFVSRLVAKSPQVVRTNFFYALSAFLQHWKGPKNLHPILSVPFNTAKIALAQITAQVPEVIDDKIEKGEIDPNQIELGLSEYLREVWNDIHAIFDPSSTYAEAVRAAEGALMASGTDPKDKKTDPKTAAAAAATASIMAAEARRVHEEDERAEKRMLDMSSEQAESLAIFRRMLDIYFLRDRGPAPHEPHTTYRLLDFVGYCPAAIKALPSLDKDEIKAVQDACDVLEKQHRRLVEESRAQTTAADRAATRNAMKAEMEAAERILSEVLNRYSAFTAMLHQEAWRRLSASERRYLGWRDWLNRIFTPASRELWRERFITVQQHWAWPIVAVILAALGFLLLVALPAMGGLATVLASIFFAASLGGAAFGLLMWSLPQGVHDGIENATGINLGAVAAWVFNLSIIGVIFFRVIGTVGDRTLELLRAVADFLDPSDGTGVIGGSVSTFGDALRKWGPLPDKTAEQIAADIERRKPKDNVTFIKVIMTTVTVGVAVVAVTMNLLFMGYHDLTVIPSLTFCLLLLIYFAAEVYTRSRYVVSEMDEKRLLPASMRRETAERMVRTASMLAGALATISIIALVFFGPVNADNALTVSQAAGGRMVESAARSLDVDLPMSPSCQAAMPDLEAGAEAAGMTVERYCRGLEDEFPCICLE